MPNHHHISVKHQQNLAFNAQIDHYIVPMDSTDEHSSHHGASPKKMMLAALAGCTGIDVVSILNKMKVEFTDFSIDIDAQLTEEHPVIYDKVSIIYSVGVEEQDRAKMEKAVSLSKDKYCGVSAMFSHFAKVDFKIEFL
jgi:putative redox protein